MNSEELKSEWGKEIGSYNGEPVILKKKTIKELLTNNIEDGISSHWCEFWKIKNPTEIPYSAKYRKESIALANGATLLFLMSDIEDFESEEMEVRQLNLDMMIEGIKKFIKTCTYEEASSLLKWNDEKKKYEIHTDDENDIDSTINDSILKIAFYG